MGSGCSSGQRIAAGGSGANSKKPKKTESYLQKEVKGDGFLTNSRWIFDNKGKVTETYELNQKILGQGSYGTVQTAQHKLTKQVRAVKSIKEVERGEPPSQKTL